MAVRLGDIYRRQVKGGEELWTVESMDNRERIKVAVTRNGKPQVTRKTTDLVTLMVAAQQGRRAAPGIGEKLQRQPICSVCNSSMSAQEFRAGFNTHDMCETTR